MLKFRKCKSNNVFREIGKCFHKTAAFFYSVKLCNMFRNIKTVKYTEAQSFLVGSFYEYSKYLKSFIINR